MATITASAKATISRIVLGVAAISAIAALAATAAIHGAPSAKAAAIDAAAPLTISRKPAGDLAPGPGIRLAKLSSSDGTSCFRASRFLRGQNRTISETFCSH